MANREITISDIQTFLEKTSKKDLLLLLQEKQQELVEVKKDVEVWNHITEEGEYIDMREVAKVLNYKNLGRNKLFAILRDAKLLMGNNEPYQRYVDMGLFKQVEVDMTDRFHYASMKPKTVVSPKGIKYIKEIVDELDSNE